MVKHSEPLNLTFSALADPTRRAILARLVDGQRTVGDLKEPFELSPSGFSKHLRVLENAGLLRQHKRGRQRYCEAVIEPLWMFCRKLNRGGFAKVQWKAVDCRTALVARRKSRYPWSDFFGLL
ncbi:MAG TPA: metalloregulator ArsR/SmtB family transcription factor [Acidobacteriota bacterium]|nr:metalloregulator ArsR/SmtB family transcription factor [Acidobacteriota bacterium]